MRRIAILGAGVSGAAVSYFLRTLAIERREDVQLKLFEASNRLGGRIQTVPTSQGLIELGAEATSCHNPAVLDLFRELRLELIPQERLPLGIKVGEELRTVDFAEFRNKYPSQQNEDFESSSKDLRSVLREKWGDEAAKDVFEPIFAAIYGCDPSILSGKLACRFGASAQFGSLTSVRGGMSEVVRRLVSCADAEVELSHPVTGFVRTDSGQWLVEAETFDDLVLCVPPPTLAPVLAPVSASLAQALQTIRFRPLNSLTLVIEGYALPNLTGVVYRDHSHLRGLTFVSKKWPALSEGRTIVRAVIDSSRWTSLEDSTATVLRELELIAGHRATVLESYVQSWNIGNCVPEVGYFDCAERIDALAEELPNIWIPRSVYAGLGISDCLTEAKSIATKIMDTKQGLPL